MKFQALIDLLYKSYNYKTAFSANYKRSYNLALGPAAFFLNKTSDSG